MSNGIQEILNSGGKITFKYGMLVYAGRIYTCNMCKQKVLGRDLEQHLADCKTNSILGIKTASK